MMTFISMRPAYIKRSISFVDRFTIQRSFYYFAYSIQLIDRYIELLLPLDPRPNLLAYTSFSTICMYNYYQTICKQLSGGVNKENHGSQFGLGGSVSGLTAGAYCTNWQFTPLIFAL